MLVEKGAWPSGRLYFTSLLSSGHRGRSPLCGDYLGNSVGNRDGIAVPVKGCFLSDNRKYELPPYGLVSDVSHIKFRM